MLCLSLAVIDTFVVLRGALHMIYEIKGIAVSAVQTYLNTKALVSVTDNLPSQRTFDFHSNPYD